MNMTDKDLKKCIFHHHRGKRKQEGIQGLLFYTIPEK